MLHGVTWSDACCMLHGVMHVARSDDVTWSDACYME